jgi:hypothetical protein
MKAAGFPNEQRVAHLRAKGRPAKVSRGATHTLDDLGIPRDRASRAKSWVRDCSALTDPLRRRRPQSAMWLAANWQAVSVLPAGKIEAHSPKEIRQQCRDAGHAWACDQRPAKPDKSGPQAAPTALHAVRPAPLTLPTPAKTAAPRASQALPCRFSSQHSPLRQFAAALKRRPSRSTAGRPRLLGKPPWPPLRFRNQHAHTSRGEGRDEHHHTATPHT